MFRITITEIHRVGTDKFLNSLDKKKHFSNCVESRCFSSSILVDRRRSQFFFANGKKSQNLNFYLC